MILYIQCWDVLKEENSRKSDEIENINIVEEEDSEVKSFVYLIKKK